MLKIVSQRAERSAPSFGTNGYGSITRAVSIRGSAMPASSTVQSGASRHVFMRRRSCTSRSVSTSPYVMPSEKSALSASSVPFSQIRLCPAKIISVVLSPKPLSA